MKQEEKQLLLRDLCTRLPYGVKAKITEEGVLSYDSGIGIIVGKEHVDNEIFILQCKNDSWCLTAISEFVPYLRPMSSMTEEEASDMLNTMFPNFRILGLEIDRIGNGRITFDKTDAENNFGHMALFFNRIYSLEQTDWLNARHFDYRGLIGKGLALEAPEGIY